MQPADVSPLLLQLCSVQDVSILGVQSVCSTESAGDLQMKHRCVPKRRGVIRKRRGLLF